MEHNYNATITATNIGSMTFAHQGDAEDDSDDQSTENDCIIDAEPMEE